ncbi:MAG TPA: hypothetical protein VGF48_15800 [Thermoanaerobaculia bacterium]|jgi:hypothetical protein
MKRLLIVLALALPLFAQTENDTSCEIAVMPAATLLVPYFEVDATERLINARTTVFTVTNVTNTPQIASVTIWTSSGRPLLTFPIFLTGYDVQAINLLDVLRRGIIAPDFGTSNATTPGSRSLANSANPRFLPSAAANCARGVVPVNLPPALLAELQTALRDGRHLTGYVTIDVSATCTARTPAEEGYWDGLLYDNVLIGDWQIISPNPPAGNYAGGSAAVHLRAIPEGGPAGAATVSSLPLTFYDRLLPEGRRGTDRRQPLPSSFAARFTEGGAASFDTELIVWREEAGPLGDVVRFDEEGDATEQLSTVSLPVAASVHTASELFPPRGNEVGGWMYLDLGRQGWVVTRMSAEGRYATGIDATPLGNGCAPREPAPIGPVRADDSCDVAQLPAATLLLPFFEADVTAPPTVAPTTLFTVINTSNESRIARVTLWTDRAYPVLTFDMLLSGYDAEPINLRELLTGGRLPGECDGLPRTIPASLLNDVRSALTTGRFAGACGSESIGNAHAYAIGYATIDVVGNCSGRSPNELEALADLRFDNVLTGDWQHVQPNPALGNYAAGNAMVHIRANAEGALPRTFYSRFYGGTGRDRRQPLPSSFAARYIQGGTSGFLTDFLVWHEPTTPARGACASYAENGRTRVGELVRFDERENPTVHIPQTHFPGVPREYTLPVTGRIASQADFFPPLQSGDVAGWMYLDLSVQTREKTANQGWVISSMFAEGRYAAAFDAAALGNGCSAIPETTIGPLR